MAVTLINVGQIANDGTGDDLREAFIKINQNFEELDLRDDEMTTVSNIGDDGEGIFYRRLGYDLEFKKLVAGQDVTLTSTTNNITISANGGLKTISLNGDIGSQILQETAILNLQGDDSITTRINGNTVTIEYNGFSQLSDDSTPILSGMLDANQQNINNVNIVNANNFIGNLHGDVIGNVHGIDIRNISKLYDVNNFDFGGIYNNITNLYDLLVVSTELNFQTFVDPGTINLDLGFII